MAQLFSSGPAWIFVAPYNIDPTINKLLPGGALSLGSTRPSITLTIPNLVVPLGEGGVVMGQPQFLGTCEHKPRISVFKHWEEVFEDATGQEEPTDLAYQGQGGLVTVALSRWNEDVYQAAVTHNITSPLPAMLGGMGMVGAPPEIGRDKPTDIGKLLVRNRVGYHLLIVFPKSMNTAYTGTPGLFLGFTGNGNAMPFGYHFYCVTLIEEDGLEPGSEHLVRYLTFRAVRVRITASGAPPANGTLAGDWVLYDHDVTSCLNVQNTNSVFQPAIPVSTL